MFAAMVATTMLAVVGAAATMQAIATKPSQIVAEESIGAGFYRYKKAVDCFSTANPGWVGYPSVAQLQATSVLGIPCLNAAFQPFPGLGSYISATNTYTYISGPTTLKGYAIPRSYAAAFFGATATGGSVSNGWIVNPMKVPNGLVMTLPAGVPTVSSLPNGSLIFVNARS